MLVVHYANRMLIVLVLTSTSTLGCSSLITSAQKGTATEHSQRCVPEIAKTQPDRALAQAKKFLPTTPSLRVEQHFSPVAVRIAETIGGLGLVNELTDLRASRPVNILKILVRRQQLTERTQLALLEVNSATAEIVCERDRTDQLADRIDEVDGARVKQLTIASIVFGGIAGIVTGGIGLAAGASVGADAATVGGGMLASWFGASALFVHSEVEFRHERNVLREVWEDPEEPRIFSPIMWRYLHRAPNSAENSPRNEVLNDWRQKGRLGEAGTTDEERRRQLFFGTGGRYGAPELRARASLLETLEASLRLIHEDLEVLIREVNESSESDYDSHIGGDSDGVESTEKQPVN